jgi:hypothetical protein
MIKFPNISYDNCPVAADTAMLLKPGRVYGCAGSTVNFAAFLADDDGEDASGASGAVFASSDTSVVTINSSTGVATLVAEGVAEISVTVGAYKAFAFVEVATGATCCDSVAVGTMLLIDRSYSMTQPMNLLFANKFEVARLIGRSVIASLDDTKDQLAIEQFAYSPEMVVGLTADTTLLKSRLAGVFANEENLPADGGTDIAAALELAYAALESCSQAVENSDTETVTTPVETTPHNFHGSGAPSESLGVAGDTYVDDDNNAFYWKSVSGWQP